MQIGINQSQAVNCAQTSNHLRWHTANIVIKHVLHPYKSRRHLTTDCPVGHINVVSQYEKIAQTHDQGPRTAKFTSYDVQWQFILNQTFFFLLKLPFFYGNW